MTGDVIAVVRESARTSAAQQAAQIVAWAAAAGYRVVRTISPEQREVAEALAELRRPELVGLVVNTLAVLGGPMVQEAVRARAMRMTGELFAVRPADARTLRETDDRDRLLLREFEAKYAELFGLEKGSQLKKGADAARADGGRVGGRPPFGWKLVAGELVEEAQLQATLTRMKALRAKGMGYAPIARQLKVEGYKTADGGDQWYPGVVKRILDRAEQNA